jgi:hypothetical protein
VVGGGGGGGGRGKREGWEVDPITNPWIGDESAARLLFQFFFHLIFKSTFTTYITYFLP